MKQPAVTAVKYSFVFFMFVATLSACNFSDDLDEYTNAVYTEDFTDLSTNTWVNTEDASQFTTPPSSYSFTLDNGQYQLTESTASEIKTTNYFKSGDTVFTTSRPYTFTAELTFPTQSVTADAMLIFNDYTNSNDVETYDYVMIMSDKTYITGYYNSSFSSSDGKFGVYTKATHNSIKTDGSINTISITQYDNAFKLVINGVKIGFIQNKYTISEPVTFMLGIELDDTSTAGEAKCLFDNLAVYN